MKTFMQKLLLEWIPLARISFGLVLLINSISNMKQIPQHFLRTQSSQLNCQVLGQIARPWNVRVKKKNNKQTNKQKEQNEPFSFTKVHNFKFFNNISSNSLKIHFICLVKEMN